MDSREEERMVNRFVSFVAPIVARHVKAVLKSAGLEFQEEGSGLDLAFSIKSGEKQLKFFIQNLLLEIATVDRDEVPLRFDERLKNFDFFVAKMVLFTKDKLKVLFHILEEENIDAAIERISQDAKHLERVRIWKFDQGEGNQKEGKSTG